MNKETAKQLGSGLFVCLSLCPPNLTCLLRFHPSLTPTLCFFLFPLLAVRLSHLSCCLYFWRLCCCWFLRQGLILWPQLACNSLGRPGWPQTYSDPPASASHLLALQACTTTPGIHLLPAPFTPAPSTPCTFSPPVGLPRWSALLRLLPFLVE